jgi:hypothetical protein
MKQEEDISTKKERASDDVSTLLIITPKKWTNDMS